LFWVGDDEAAALRALKYERILLAARVVGEETVSGEDEGEMMWERRRRRMAPQAAEEARL
jgi:hypothetical protein